MSAVFSRVRGSSGFLVFLPSCGLVVGGWGVGLSGGFSGSGLGAPGSCSLWGWGSGAPGAPGSCVFVRGLGACVRLVLASLVLGGGGWVRLCVWFILGMRFPGVGRAARLLCFVRGLGVPGFLFRVRGVFCRVRGGVSGCFCFRSALPSSGLGVSGWVGVVFLRLLCSVRVRVGSLLGVGPGSGLGLVLFGEFDPGSGRTLAACLTHASRTGPSLFLGGGLSGERVSIT